jgi:Predicted phosphohydrolase (DHH superfamily)
MNWIVFLGGCRSLLFDHHKSTFELYANRPWAVVDTGYCGALVYWRWLMAQELSPEMRKNVEGMEHFVLLANDRDLWLGQNPDGRLWQGLITLCGAWAVLMRLVDNPSPVLTQGSGKARSILSPVKKLVLYARKRASSVWGGLGLFRGWNFGVW